MDFCGFSPALASTREFRARQFVTMIVGFGMSWPQFPIQKLMKRLLSPPPRAANASDCQEEHPERSYVVCLEDLRLRLISEGGDFRALV
eukprot:9482356-Pyramimonas_sp.AAC.1